MERLRSLLFMPGNNPAMLQSGGVFEADAVILDLEDAVALREKDAARMLVRAALNTVDYGVSRTVVRINTLDTFGYDDIQAIVPAGPQMILLPKVESPDAIRAAAAAMQAVERPGQQPVQLIALIETPCGLAEALSIARADARVTALALGAEDYTASLGAQRTKSGAEIITARSLLVNAAAAAGIDALDTPFTDVNDEAGLVADTQLAKQLGFKGKLCINPRQIDTVHAVFNPSEAEVIWAKRVLGAIRQAEAEGAGVVALDGKMIDAPIVSRAQRTLALARLQNPREVEA